MPWEQRKGTTNRYFTFSFRVGRAGKRRRLYIGEGLLGEIAAGLEFEWRAEQELRRRAREEEDRNLGESFDDFAGSGSSPAT